MSNTGSGRGMRWDEAPYYRSVSSKGAGRPRLTHHHKGWWNETKWMCLEKCWNEICGRGKREKSREKPTLTPFLPPRNPHGVTETRTRDPSAAVGGERLTACATRPQHVAIIDPIIKQTCTNWKILEQKESFKMRMWKYVLERTITRFVSLARAQGLI